ncbi:MAG: DoxX family membrane protein [bacterium]|nr:DoxX family membrane protein [bacterium]
MKISKIAVFLSSDTVQLIARLFLGGIFVYAGVYKVVHPDAFEKAVAGYKLLPSGWVHFVSTALPWMEFFAGALLISGLLIRTTTIFLSGLLVLFIAAVGITVFRGNFTGCGCFSKSGGVASTWDGLLVILRDLVFLVPASIILRFHIAHNSQQIA